MQNGVTLPDESHSDLLTMMEDGSEKVRKQFPNDSFQRLLWDHQLEYARKKNPRQMRWHPMMICW